MLGIKVKLRSAETLRKFLKKKGLLESNYRIMSGNSFIYFPLRSPYEAHLEKSIGKYGAKLVDKPFKKAPTPTLSMPYFEGATHGYDSYGSIAVIDAPPKVARDMAKSLMKTNNNIKTVLRKKGAVKGIYRTRKFEYVAGEKNYMANYKENNCLFTFDIRKVFFSPRLAYERKRVNDSVKQNENVLVMFAGVGPYAIEIGKLHQKTKVVGIELNKQGYDYMKQNIKLNNVQNVVAEHGSISKFSKKYAKFADRIIMPLPKDAHSFLTHALKMGKKQCTIHYYSFSPIGKYDSVVESLKLFFRKNNKKFKLLNLRSVRPYSSHESEIVVDFKIY